MLHAVLIGLGGALGSVARNGLGLAVTRVLGFGFPYGTLLANVLGSLLIGCLYVVIERYGRGAWGEPARYLLIVGFCGGFTTFSTFSLQTLGLLQAGAWLKAGLNIAGSVGLCLGACWLGVILAQAALGR